jgi:hypothetical protein
MAVAMERFRSAGLSPAEAVLAAGALLRTALADFRQDLPAFRERVGAEVAGDFARGEFNDFIGDLQDCVPPAVRAYNALIRGVDGDADIPG